MTVLFWVGLALVIGIPIFFMFFNPNVEAEHKNSRPSIKVNNVRAGGKIVINGREIRQDENGNLVALDNGEPIFVDGVEVEGNLTIKVG